MANGVLFLEYPKCSTCQKAKRWLDAQGVTYTDRDIVEDNPTADELRVWHEMSGLPLKRFFNTSGMLYREMELSKKTAYLVRGGAIRPARHQRHAREAPAAGNRRHRHPRLQGSRLGGGPGTVESCEGRPSGGAPLASSHPVRAQHPLE